MWLSHCAQWASRPFRSNQKPPVQRFIAENWAQTPGHGTTSLVFRGDFGSVTLLRGLGRKEARRLGSFANSLIGQLLQAPGNSLNSTTSPQQSSWPRLALLADSPPWLGSHWSKSLMSPVTEAPPKREAACVANTQAHRTVNKQQHCLPGEPFSSGPLCLFVCFLTPISRTTFVTTLFSATRLSTMQVLLASRPQFLLYNSRLFVMMANQMDEPCQSSSVESYPHVMLW